jgi:hypothetical protein
LEADLAAELSKNYRLWVPMQLRALVFGQPGTAEFVDLTPTYGELRDRQDAPLGHKLRPILEAEKNPEFLPNGIHLHWMLPASFFHIRPAADGASKSLLPSVPNRWLVIRLWQPEPATLKQLCWVVESDFRDDDSDSGAPWFEANNGSYRITRLGRQAPLDEWTISSNPGEAITAFAPGNLGFAAFYPSCRGTFGFHDAAEDLKPDTICTYLVAGWFADPASGPLEQAQTAKHWSELMAQREWAIPDGSAFLSTSITCYAIAPGIKWTPDTPCAPPERGQPPVAIGNSILEAVAALTKGGGSITERARLANELQFAALAERRPTRWDLRHPNFFAEILGKMSGVRAKLHERAFSAHAAGSFWEIVRESEANSRDGDAQPLLQLPPGLAGQLENLNSLQREYDDIQRTLAGWQRRLFAAWYQHQYWSARRRVGSTRVPIADLLAEVENCKTEVGAWAGKLNAAGLKAGKDGLEGELNSTMPTASLVARSMPRFWRANDPFVLMSGISAPAMQGGASPLQCRVSDQTIAHIEVADVEGQGRITVTRSELRAELEKQKILPLGRDNLPQDVAELLIDALFADPERAGILARIYLGSNPSPGQIETVRGAIADVQRERGRIGTAVAEVEQGKPVNQSADFPIKGLADPALVSFLSALNLTSTAMSRPVFMVWRANWLPYRGTEDQPVSDHWSLAEGVDLDLKQAVPQAGGKPRNIDGFSLIATNLERGFAATKREFAEPEYQFALQQLTKLAGLSLTGLTDALATQDTGPQLPPLKRDASRLVRDPIADLVGDHYAVAPRPIAPDDRDAGSRFSPLRGGDFSLTRLWIVDSFGRIQKIIDTETGIQPAGPPILSRSLAIPGLPPEAGHLPPRLLQPTRLQLRWLSATDDTKESLGDISTGPICGFVSHNRLDRSLMIYGASKAEPTSLGTLLGAVQALDLPQGQEEPRWSALPARPFIAPPGTGGVTRPTEADIPNPHLRGFVNGLLALADGAGNAFKAFRELLSRHDEAADLSMDQGLQPILIGRPLALALASLRLELDGPPLRDESAEQALSGDPPYLSVKFPVRLGDRRLGPDGLVGYFVHDSAQDAYGRLRLVADETFTSDIVTDTDFQSGVLVTHDPAAIKLTPSNAYFDQSGLEVTCNPKAAAIKLTLLLDPKQGVHVSAGILPANLVAIPRPLVTQAMSDLDIPFLVAPVLGERRIDPAVDPNPHIPLPTDGHDEWRWAFFRDAAATSSEEIAVTVDAAAAPSLSTAMALHEGWLKYRPSKGEKS